MSMNATRRVVPVRNERSSVFKRVGGAPVINKVCSFWLAGRCKKNPCRFLHELPVAPKSNQCYHGSQPIQPKQYINSAGSNTWQRDAKNGPKKLYVPPSGKAECGGGKIVQKPQDKVIYVPSSGDVECGGGKIVQKPQEKVISVPPSGDVECGGDKIVQKPQEKVICKYWISDNCVHGDKCRDLHSWFTGSGFSMLTKLEGHTKDVTGIALPAGSDKLYSGSKDKSVRVWDCNTGQCLGSVSLEGEIGCVISEGPWVFVGLPNAVKARNTQNHTDLSLDGPFGAVHAMVGDGDMLFAGTQDGTILACKIDSVTSTFELVASLKGHTDNITSLVIGANNRLYSGSFDRTIRVWDCTTFDCVQTLNGHTDVVMSVICWDSYLLSGSLDGTLKVWAATADGNLEVIYSHNIGHGALAFCGILDSEAKPILLCSLDDSTVRLLDLPLLEERGKIFAKRQVRSIQIGPGGLFFTGDATGQLGVWKLSGDPSVAAVAAP